MSTSIIRGDDAVDSSKIVQKDANGNIGIGVTPSAWHTNAKSIDIGTVSDSGSFYSSVGINHSHVAVGANHYYDSSFVPKYKGSYAASVYQQANGNHHWYTAPSGTAGNPITWTTAMILDNTGNLLLTLGTGGLGYGTGSGGTVTQLTSKSITVTLNKSTGEIITASDALASGAEAEFQINNSLIGINDTIIALCNSGSYRIKVSCGYSGLFFIKIKNETASSLSQAITIKFSIVKGANS